MYHFEIELYTKFPIWKKMTHVKILPFSSHVGLFVVFTLDHDWLVDHILSNNRAYNLQFSCAYLKCDKEGSSRVLKWVHIPLIFCHYISYIVPIFLFPKFLYSYISDTHSCLTPCYYHMCNYVVAKLNYNFSFDDLYHSWAFVLLLIINHVLIMLYLFLHASCMISIPNFSHRRLQVESYLHELYMSCPLLLNIPDNSPVTGKKDRQ